MNNILTKACHTPDYTLTPEALNRLKLFTVLALIGFPAFCILETLKMLDGFSKPVHFVISTLLLMSAIPLFSDRIFNHLNRNYAKLDEREREVVRKAKAFAYKWVLIGLIVSIAIGMSLLGIIGVKFKTPYVDFATMSLIAMNIAFFMLFLPITYIAWTQKPLLSE